MNLRDCFICGFKPQRSLRFRNNAKETEEEEKCVELILVKDVPQENFILTQVLELSSRDLRRLPKKKGTRPGSTSVSLCQACSLDVKDIQRIYEELQEITEKFNEAKDRIQAILKAKSRSVDIGGESKEDNEDFDELPLGDNAMVMPTSRGKRKTSTATGHYKIKCLKTSELVEVEVPIKQEKESEADYEGSDGNSDESWNDLNSSDPLDSEEEMEAISSGSEEETNEDNARNEFASLNQEEGDQSVLNTSFNCTHCPSKFSSEERLKAHRRRKHNLDRFKCNFCDKDFQTRAWLRKHKARVHEKDIYPCPQCSKSFQLPSSLKLHISTLHERKYRHTCEVCGKGFTKKTRYQTHLYREHDIAKEKLKLYTCPVEGCSKILTRLHYFNDHMARHEGKPAPFQCTLCPSDFFSKSSLHMHEMRVHNLDPPEGHQYNLPKCEKCGKLCGSKKVLGIHFKICGKRAIKCDVCESPFYREADLRSHKKFKHPEVAVAEEPKELETENGNGNDKRFQCSECGKTFAQPAPLRAHIQMVHKNESKHTCSVCGVPKWSKIQLAQHMFNEHGIGEPRFQCETCGQTFWHMFQKKRHICNGVQPPRKDLKMSVCEICGKEFKYSAKKRMHVEEVHNKKKKRT